MGGAANSPRANDAYDARMARFLAIFNGAADETQKLQLSDEQRADFMNAWATWAAAHQGAIVDNGSPLHRKKRVTADDVVDFTDSKTSFAIVEASSLEEAAHVFTDHPHVRLITGNSIEVLECPPVPG